MIALKMKKVMLLGSKNLVFENYVIEPCYTLSAITSFRVLRITGKLPFFYAIRRNAIFQTSKKIDNVIFGGASHYNVIHVLTKFGNSAGAY